MSRTSHRRWRILVSASVGAVTLLAGFAHAQESTENAPASVPPPPSGISCAWMPPLRSQYYSVIDDQHLVIEATGRRYYLITLTRRCFDLDTTLDIGLSSHGDQLCTGDAIIIDRDRCTIGSVEAVANEAEAKMLVQARAAAEKARRQRNN